MSDLLAADIVTVAEFVAHALEMESESAERYRELANNMETHNNLEVAALFRVLAEEGDTHTEQVKSWGAEMELPDIAPWAFKWSTPDAPESPAMEDVHYLMTRRQALELALHNEIRGKDFYRQVSERSRSDEIQRLAREMAREEEAHVALLRTWLRGESEDAPLPPVSDLDPPNMPE